MPCCRSESRCRSLNRGRWTPSPSAQQQECHLQSCPGAAPLCEPQAPSPHASGAAGIPPGGRQAPCGHGCRQIHQDGQGNSPSNAERRVVPVAGSSFVPAVQITAAGRSGATWLAGWTETTAGRSANGVADGPRSCSGSPSASLRVGAGFQRVRNGALRPRVSSSPESAMIDISFFTEPLSKDYHDLQREWVRRAPSDKVWGPG